jgi:hypothetical protein
MNTYDWKYLICPKGKPTWGLFIAEHGTFPTHPFSNRDFDCTRVAEAIAKDVVLDGEWTICMEDPRGHRYEVDVETVSEPVYRMTNCRDLGTPKREER